MSTSSTKTNESLTPAQRDLANFLEGEGYFSLKVLDDGRMAGLFPFIYTCGLCVGLDRSGYRYRYCYKNTPQALAALQSWDGSGDAPGPWIVRKGLGTDLRNHKYPNIEK